MTRLFFRWLIVGALAAFAGMPHAASLGIAPTTGAGPVTFIPSRTSGVAPLYVFFDTVGQVPAAVSREPFLELEYKWDFGDVTAGTWAFGSMAGVASKNAAVGPVAGHIFETPGTYSVCLTVKDRVGAVLTPTCQTITVDDPEVVFASNTVCINAVGADFTGCPVGAATVTSADFDAEMTTQVAAGKRRILLKRGDTFNLSTPWAPTVTGPALIGAFGSGARPKVLNGTANVMLTFNTAGIGDWRVLDLELDGNSATNVQAIQPNRYAYQLTFLRLDIHHTNVGYSTAISTIDGLNAALPCTGTFPYTGGGCTNPVWDQVAIQDCEIYTLGTPGVSGGGNGLYFSAIRGAVLGNRIEDANNGQGEHIVRIAFADRLALSHNYLAYPKVNKSILTTRGPNLNGSNTLAAGTHTQYVLHSFNKLVGGDGLNSMIVVLPVTANIPYQTRYLIYDSNLLIAGAGTQAMMSFDATAYGMVRNNVFNQNLGYGALLGAGSGDAVPQEVSYLYIYNNTLIKTTASPTCTGVGEDKCGGWTAMQLSRRVNNAHIKNNLLYAPLVTSTPPGWYGITNLSNHAAATSATLAAVSNNTSTVQMLNTNPNFINASGTFGLLSDYKPACTGSTYPCGQGTPVPVWSDALQVPSTATRDLGAVIH